MSSLWPGVSTLVLAAAFWYQRDYQSQFSKIFPDAVILLTALLGVVLLVRGLLRRHIPAEGETVPPVTLLVITTVIFAWAALLRPLGFLVSGAASFLVLCRFARTRRSGWRGVLLDVAVSITAVFILHFIFTEYLFVRLPRGSVW